MGYIHFSACVMLRVDSLNVDLKEASCDIGVSGTKLVYFLRFDKVTFKQTMVISDG